MDRRCRGEGDHQDIHEGRRSSGKEVCSCSEDTQYPFDQAYSIIARLESFHPVLSSLQYCCCTLDPMIRPSIHTLAPSVFEICRSSVLVGRNMLTRPLSTSPGVSG